METAYGLCKCGCGGTTNIAPKSRLSRGWVKGEPQPYLRGHAAWKDHGPRWIEGPVPPHRPELGPCWLWQRWFNNQGYPLGSFAKFGGKHLQLAHRGVWEQMIGPIKDGHVLDHLCRVPACVNPRHLEPVTQLVNVQRQPRVKVREEDLPRVYEMRLNGMSWRAIAAKYDMTYQPLIGRMRAWCTRNNTPYV